MTTTLSIFMTNEIVHAVDQTTGIWEEAKVLGHESDWSLRIKWVNWGTRKPLVFTLHPDIREKSVENWTIRKKVVLPTLPSATGRRPLRQTAQPTTITGPYQAYTANPRKITSYDEVSPVTQISLQAKRHCNQVNKNDSVTSNSQ